MRKREFLGRAGRLGLAAAAMQAPLRAWSAAFLDPAQARKLLLPAAEGFEARPVALDEAQLERVARIAQTRVPRGFAPRVERATDAGGALAGWVVYDAVIGKTELIDYAVGLDATGAVAGVEILAYRESHGAEIRTPAFRRQFVGKRAPAQLVFEDDVRNITGATMSCRHLTEGVRRVSALHAVALAEPPR